MGELLTESQIILYGHDPCPECRNVTLPRVRPDEGVTAVCCRECGYVAELKSRAGATGRDTL